MLAKLLLRPAESGGGQRYRRAGLTSLLSISSQFVQLATGLISIPLALNYVGSERFGIWMTLSTALAFISFADFGIGIGVQDRMSRLVATESYDLACKTLSTSLVLVILIFGLMLAATHVSASHLDLSSVLSLKSPQAIEEIVPTTKVVVLVLGLGLVSGVVQRAFNAFQEGYWIAIIQMVARVSSLVMLFVVVHLRMGLPALVFVVGGTSSVAIVLIGYPLLLLRHRFLSPFRLPILSALDTNCLSGVFKIGILGLGASMSIYLVNNSAPVIIATKYGAENVVDFAVLLKLLGVPMILLTYLLIPLWPAITEARESRDVTWIRDAYKKSITVTAVAGISAATVFLFFGRPIILAWTQNESAIPGFGLLLATVSFMVLGFWNTLISVFLNGLSLYKSQATYGLALASLSVLVATLLPAEFGKASVVWLIAAGYLIRCVLLQLQLNGVLRSLASEGS